MNLLWPLIVGALAVVLLERLVLDRRYGRTPVSYMSSNPAAALADAVITAGILTAGAALAWPAAALLLVPAGAGWCYGAVLIFSFTGLALAVKPVIARRRSRSMADRRCVRAAAVSSLMGVTVLVPQAIAGAGRFPAFTQSVRTAALAAAVFAGVGILYRGLREHIALAGNGEERGSPVAEFLTAGLMALAFAGLRFLAVPG
jgi:Na+-translocating ferredoxin:NAD+ oxidoreductase RnfA subunit